jgi:hypothetical protein
MEKNKTIGALRSFTLTKLARLNNYSGLGYGRFKTTPNQEKELDWTTKLLIATNQLVLERFDEAYATVTEIESILDFLASQDQLDKLSLIKAQILINLERIDEARESLREIEAFSKGFQQEIAQKMLESLETFEKYESVGDRSKGSKTWKQVEPSLETQN